MSDDKARGQVSYEARQVAKGRRMGADDSTPDSEILAVIGLAWAELPTGMQADEEAGAQAAVAHVVNPTAEDYDHAAEIMRLRALVAEILADFWPGERFTGISEGLRDAQARVDGYRERAGLEVQR